MDDTQQPIGGTPPVADPSASVVDTPVPPVTDDKSSGDTPAADTPPTPTLPTDVPVTDTSKPPAEEKPVGDVKLPGEGEGTEAAMPDTTAKPVV